MQRKVAHRLRVGELHPTWIDEGLTAASNTVAFALTEQPTGGDAVTRPAALLGEESEALRKVTGVVPGLALIITPKPAGKRPDPTPVLAVFIPL